MESLLCEEVWLSSPASPIEFEHVEKSTCGTLDGNGHHGECHMCKEDCDQALIIFLEEEKRYVPMPKYMEYLGSKNLIVARFKSIQWFIKCRSRLNLSFQTVFYAANYLDRFLSMKQYCDVFSSDRSDQILLTWISKFQQWKYRMVDLVAVACLSIASKFSETTTPTLHEINQIMDDMERSFEPSRIQRMELMILQALDWRLACTTAYSYVEMFSRSLQIPHLHQQIITQVNHLLLRAISDTKMLGFRPSLVALSALCCCLDKLHSTASTAHHSSLTRFFNHDQKDDLVKCCKMMEKQWIGTRLYDVIAHEGHCYNYCPSSPTTVLLKDRTNIRDFNVDLSLSQITHRPQFNHDQSRSRKKAKK